MTKSFSATDYKGVDVKGTVIYEDATQSFCLVNEDTFPGPPTLWLIDKLDDVGISLDPEQLLAILPHLNKWVGL